MDVFLIHLIVEETILKIIYKIYQPDKGYEEIQAKIYNHNSGRNVTGKEIQERFEREKVDPNSIRYAFNEDMKPLAYVQARDYPQMGEIHIGYPWALPDCPIEVQEKLFDDLFEYMMNRKTELKLKMSVLNEDKYLHFINRKDFKKEREFFNYDVSIKDGLQIDPELQGYSSRYAKKEDFKDIVDTYINGFFNGDENRRQQIESIITRAFERDVLILMFKNQKLIGGASFSKNDPPEEFIRPGPFFTLPDFEDCIITLIQKISTHVKENNWDKKYIRIPLSNTDVPDIKAIETIPHKKKISAMKFGI